MYLFRPMRDNRIFFFCMMKLTVRAECCLSGAPPLLVKAVERALTLENPRYEDALRYGRWIGKKLQPRLFFFRKEGSELYFPRGFGNGRQIGRASCRERV